MADYVKRSDALKFSVSIVGKLFSEEFDIEQEIQKIPSADVAEVRHGEWIEKEVFYDENADVISDWQSARCSVCNTYHTTPYSYYFTDYNFCPNCGARMDGGA